MSEPERYTTVELLQDRLTERADAVDGITQALAAASTAVERYCHRVFTLAGTASARVFAPLSASHCIVDDIGSTTDLEIALGWDGQFDTTLTSTEFWFLDPNAIERGEPFTDLRSAGLFTRLDRPTVQVTARWGWPAIPDDVAEAVLLLASRLWSRRTSPTGVAGFSEYGVVRITAADADVTALLYDYRRTGLR